MAQASKARGQQSLFDKHGRANWADGKRVRHKRRKRPGRKPKGARAGAPHTVRPELKPREPVHVVLRVVQEIGNLRRRRMYKALREATIAAAKRAIDYVLPSSKASRRSEPRSGGFRIVHLSIQRNHIHLLCEADHKLALARGMQGFQISAAKHLNRALSVETMRAADRRSGWYQRAMAQRRRGTVFPDRYHQEVIRTPAQARRTLAYVLNNWRKHGEDRGARERAWHVDPFSSGVLFDGWSEREEATVRWRWRDTYDPLVVYLPTTWLLRVGWRKHGLITFREVPSSKSPTTRGPHVPTGAPE